MSNSNSNSSSCSSSSSCSHSNSNSSLSLNKTNKINRTNKNKPNKNDNTDNNINDKNNTNDKKLKNNPKDKDNKEKEKIKITIDKKIPDPPNDPTVVKKKKTRTRNGCLTCRDRHLKCDEAEPICLNCLKTSRKCVRGLRLNFIKCEIFADFKPAYLLSNNYHSNLNLPNLDNLSIENLNDIDTDISVDTLMNQKIDTEIPHNITFNDDSFIDQSITVSSYYLNGFDKYKNYLKYHDEKKLLKSKIEFENDINININNFIKRQEKIKRKFLKKKLKLNQLKNQINKRSSSQINNLLTPSQKSFKRPKMSKSLSVLAVSSTSISTSTSNSTANSTPTPTPNSGIIPLASNSIITSNIDDINNNNFIALSINLHTSDFSSHPSQRLQHQSFQQLQQFQQQPQQHQPNHILQPLSITQSFQHIQPITNLHDQSSAININNNLSLKNINLPDYTSMSFHPAQNQQSSLSYEPQIEDRYQFCSYDHNINLINNYINETDHVSNMNTLTLNQFSQSNNLAYNQLFSNIIDQNNNSNNNNNTNFLSHSDSKSFSDFDYKDGFDIFSDYRFLHGMNENTSFLSSIEKPQDSNIDFQPVQSIQHVQIASSDTATSIFSSVSSLPQSKQFVQQNTLQPQVYNGVAQQVLNESLTANKFFEEDQDIKYSYNNQKSQLSFFMPQQTKIDQSGFINLQNNDFNTLDDNTNNIRMQIKDLPNPSFKSDKDSLLLLGDTVTLTNLSEAKLYSSFIVNSTPFLDLFNDISMFKKIISTLGLLKDIPQANSINCNDKNLLFNSLICCGASCFGFSQSKGLNMDSTMLLYRKLSLNLQMNLFDNFFQKGWSLLSNDFLNSFKNNQNPNLSSLYQQKLEEFIISCSLLLSSNHFNGTSLIKKKLSENLSKIKSINRNANNSLNFLLNPESEIPSIKSIDIKNSTSSLSTPCSSKNRDDFQLYSKLMGFINSNNKDKQVQSFLSNETDLIVSLFNVDILNVTTNKIFCSNDLFYLPSVDNVKYGNQQFYNPSCSTITSSSPSGRTIFDSTSSKGSFSSISQADENTDTKKNILNCNSEETKFATNVDNSLGFGSEFKNTESLDISIMNPLILTGIIKNSLIIKNCLWTIFSIDSVNSLNNYSRQHFNPYIWESFLTKDDVSNDDSELKFKTLSLSDSNEYLDFKSETWFLRKMLLIFSKLFYFKFIIEDKLNSNYTNDLYSLSFSLKKFNISREWEILYNELKGYENRLSLLLQPINICDVIGNSPYKDEVEKFFFLIKFNFNNDKTVLFHILHHLIYLLAEKFLIDDFPSIIDKYQRETSNLNHAGKYSINVNNGKGEKLDDIYSVDIEHFDYEKIRCIEDINGLKSFFRLTTSDKSDGENGADNQCSLAGFYQNAINMKYSSLKTKPFFQELNVDLNSLSNPIACNIRRLISMFLLDRYEYQSKHYENNNYAISKEEENNKSQFMGSDTDSIFDNFNGIFVNLVDWFMMKTDFSQLELDTFHEVLAEKLSS
ncbi:Zn(II)2Cys6 transcription factor domain-containing protein ASCRUDRAFT_68461 [Ascoidea rubescens DSM 1968]|uniref:Zn(2)-C6 fungal-type domain-containing protein n=1 Tax=Ascoidea rubescens DSM 1968 TaxID=1344418 RepID=A0A1D2VSD9_9ASCO|nr:hypothetical protein ASCRUDRAFT_68461 [Ascoidea rubescens DSM 1968]ODV64487.1 hypothetical protein ASCRUDRAFT_68461 [Ascoidea rubescens DSM 1968]